MRTYIDEEALMKLIQRQGYLDFLRRNRERPIIKVVSGIRRCGKSTLFRLFKDELLADNVKPEQIISINFEELEYEHLRDYHALYQYILERMQPNETNYIFLDEILWLISPISIYGSLLIFLLSLSCCLILSLI